MTSQTPDRQVITILRTLDGRPANKKVELAPDGKLIKSKAKEPGRYRAFSTAVPDLATLAYYLGEVGKLPDMLLCLDEFVGAPAEFTVFSMAEMAARLGVPETDREAIAGWHDLPDFGRCCCRMKENVVPSNIVLFDRDLAPGMPAALADLDHDAWCAAVDRVVPGFAGCGKVVVPSTTNRIIGGPPQAGLSGHTYVLVDDPDAIQGQLEQAALRALLTEHDGTGLAFGKPCRCRATGARSTRSGGRSSTRASGTRAGSCSRALPMSAPGCRSHHRTCASSTARCWRWARRSCPAPSWTPAPRRSAC